ncbi:hypothetical protein CN03_03045 [Thalassolituus oleivorans]|jgi:hypothetical protein|uniref:hypothetical protein n=1 Tax=Thalassolituus oleivorans TaxID=187493 RepID=UPI00094927B2|nr:hypothetical protein [Thalassolituus oleivorans]APR65992.1 hypothetical protein CN03_03045 [Thalassolituus oleivorans]
MPKIVITEETMSKVLKLILTWRGKLTWTLLCERVSEILEIDNITRQTLSSYQEIQAAYSQRKEQLRNSDSEEANKKKNTNAEYLLNKIDGLEAELTIARTTIEKYKQQFVRWQYNAYLHGIRMESLDDAIEMLENPLVEINRRTGGS